MTPRQAEKLMKASRFEPLLTHSADGSGLKQSALRLLWRTRAKVAGRLSAAGALLRSSRMRSRLDRSDGSIHCAVYGAGPVTCVYFLIVSLTEDVNRG
jgi:hypothetical protein